MSQSVEYEVKFRQCLAVGQCKNKKYYVNNKDICKIPKFLACFTKGLPHDITGVVDKDEYCKLLEALDTNDLKLLQKVKLGGTRKLVNPSAIWEPDVIGRIRATYKLKAPLRWQSDEFAAQQLELYCMSLTRDVNFADYATDPEIIKCADALKPFIVTTPANMYRSEKSPGSLFGPYVSQFFLRTFTMGTLTIEQKYPPYEPGVDYLTNFADTLTTQNGNIVGPPMTRLAPRYIITGRDLATAVHVDEPDQYFYQTYCMLANDLGVPANPGLPVSKVENFFISEGGKVDANRLLGEAVALAMETAWVEKWTILLARPEAMGLEIDYTKNNTNRTGISNVILDSPILADSFAKYGSYVLSQGYQEGSPTHPSYPAGHATLSGAASVILKFLFDGDTSINLLQPDATGDNLIDTGLTSTVGHEIDKLATNIAFGRNFAGIHYRQDARGIQLGEQVAIYYLRDMVQRYRYPVCVTIKLADGKKVTITNIDAKCSEHKSKHHKCHSSDSCSC